VEAHVDAKFAEFESRLGIGLMMRSAGAIGGGQSSTDALLKRSNLLAIEAMEHANDAFEQNRQRLLSEFQVAVAAGNKTMDQLLGQTLGEVIDPESRAKLQEALSLIQNAEQEDPYSVAALLQHFQVNYLLDPSDRPGRRRLMDRAIALLDMPTDDRERLQLAEATYYRGLSSDPVDYASLMKARTMFQELGRNEYVQQIDAQMVAGQGAPQAPGPIGNIPSLAGRWSIQFGSGEQEVVDIYPDGTLRGTLQRGWERHTVTGQWAFDPSMATLGIQTLVDNYMPVANQLRIRGTQGGGYFGVDARGMNFVMSRG